jgi:hypothetical protein
MVWDCLKWVSGCEDSTHERSTTAQDERHAPDSQDEENFAHSPSQYRKGRLNLALQHDSKCPGILRTLSRSNKLEYEKYHENSRLV